MLAERLRWHRHSASVCDKIAECIPLNDDDLLALRDGLLPENVHPKSGISRWSVAHDDYGRIFLHRRHGDDHTVLHDHPWHSKAFHLRGLVTEYYGLDETAVDLRHGDTFYRAYDTPHRMQLRSVEAWSLFIVGKPIRHVWYWHNADGATLANRFNHKQDGLALT